jgi:hypothetical protein
MNSNAKNVRKEPLNGMSRETQDYTPNTAPTPGLPSQFVPQTDEDCVNADREL